MKYLAPLALVLALLGCRTSPSAPQHANECAPGVDSPCPPAPERHADPLWRGDITADGPQVRRLETVDASTEDAQIAKSLVRIRSQVYIPAPLDATGNPVGLPRMALFAGTGFAVAPHIVWTATHVLEADEGKVLRQWVILPDGTTIEITGWRRLRGDAAEATLARAHGLPLLEVGSKAPAEWTAALTVGWPETQEFIVSVRGHLRVVANQGAVHPALREMGGRWAEMTLPLLHGMSGSPVLVGGKVVGIVSADPPGPYTSATLCDHETLAEALAPAPAPQTPPEANPPSGAPGESEEDCPSGT